MVPGNCSGISQHSFNTRARHYTTGNYTITAAKQHQRTDYNLYEGMEVTGMPSVVLSRGRVLVQEGEWKGEQGAGGILYATPALFFGMDDPYREDEGWYVEFLRAKKSWLEHYRAQLKEGVQPY